MFDVKDSATAGYRRVEVLTGPERRRRWTAEDKARIVAESLAPEAVVSVVARRWQVCPQQLFAWRREAARGSAAGTTRGVDCWRVGPGVRADRVRAGGGGDGACSPEAASAPAPTIEVELAVTLPPTCPRS